MNPKEKLLQDIKTLMESIQLDWKDLGALQLTAQDRAGIKQHIEWCLNELKDLLAKLNSGCG